ncbi:pseudaminic acid synthase [Rubrivirga sp. IMCC43871]|uniref:pseudaminic acid synthase n=1 Tax=Rubrivirga sp. IMCC43871 TaxID=3391575 RepID=UPI00399029AA
MNEITIGSRRIADDTPPYVVAEMSANHLGDVGRAVAIVEAAAAAGADAVKLQTYTADSMTLRSDRAPFRVSDDTPWGGTTLYELYERAATPWAWHPRLKTLAEGLGLDLFSSPFDAATVDALDRLGVPAYKVASFEIVDLPLLRAVAATGKPVIVSTGLATREEVDEAVTTLLEAGASEIALLTCTSAYPARPDEMNLRGLGALTDAFGTVVGLSDHTLGETVPVAAVALGARIVEKHLTLARGDGGPDAAFSLEPDEFARMVRAVREAYDALGGEGWGPTDGERPYRSFRRSLWVAEAIPAGSAVTPANVRVLRPGHGLHPRHLGDVMGRSVAHDLDAGTPLTWDALSGNPSRTTG